MKYKKLDIILPKLDEVSKFIKFGRKAVTEDIRTVLADVDTEISSLNRNIEQLEDRKKELSAGKDKQDQYIKKLKKYITKLTQHNNSCIKSIKAGKEKLQTISATNVRQDEQITNFKVKINSLTKNKEEQETKIANLESEIRETTELKSKLEQSIEELNNQIQEREERISTLQKDFSYVSDRFDLISEILAAKPCLNDGLVRFKNVLYGEIMDFANDESSLDEEAKAIMMLQSVEKELELIAGFPGIFNKNIFAIGGGFSSGKSQFVNSFIKQDNVKLPVGMKPVTAIPTYVVADNQCNIQCYSKNGGKIDISESFFKNLSHDYIKSFKFNLKEIMPFMTLSCHLPLEYFENICFIDTPGYNPAVTDNYTDEDKRTSSEYLKRANILIWMIGLDSQGTIPASDLDFLSELGLDDKKLYVVANKADLRSGSELEDILDEISESLEDYDIEYCGISAFSAKRNKEYLYKKESLLDFLQKENNQVGEQKKIKKTIKEVLDKYKKAIGNDVQNAKNIKSDLHSLDLDLLETGYEFDAEMTEKINTRLAGLQQVYDVKKLEKQLKTLDGLDKRINAVVDDFFKCME